MVNVGKLTSKLPVSEEIMYLTTDEETRIQRGSWPKSHLHELEKIQPQAYVPLKPRVFFLLLGHYLRT